MRLVVRSDHRLGGGCVGLRTLDPTDSELRVEARFQPGHEVLEAPTGVCDGATRSTNLGRLQDSVAVGHHDRLGRLVDPLGVGQLSQPVVDRRRQARLGDEEIRGVSFLPVFTDSRLGLRRRRTGARSCAGRSETPTKARADPRRPRRTPRAAHRGRPLRDRPSRSVPSRGSADRLSPRTDERCCSWSATDDVAGAHLNLGELVACSVEGRTWHQARPVSKPVQRLRWCGRVWQRLLLSDVERPPTGKRAAPLPCRAACP